MTNPVLVESGKVELDWEFDYDGDTSSIPTEEEMKSIGKHYAGLKYFFTVEVNGHVFGRKQESGLLEFKETIDIYLYDQVDAPVPDKKFKIVFADNSEKKGTVDENGYVKFENVPPGPYSLEVDIGIDDLNIPPASPVESAAEGGSEGSGETSGLGGSLSGETSGLSGSVSGGLSGLSGSLSGESSGLSGSVSGGLSGLSGSLSGETSGLSGSVSGGFSGPSGSLSGESSGLNGSLSGESSGLNGSLSGGSSGLSGEVSVDMKKSVEPEKKISISTVKKIQF
jgi:hypothetical protein